MKTLTPLTVVTQQPTTIDLAELMYFLQGELQTNVMVFKNPNKEEKEQWRKLNERG